jgi:hypothetical protein
VTQLVEHQSSKPKTLSTNPSTAKKNSTFYDIRVLLNLQ